MKRRAAIVIDRIKKWNLKFESSYMAEAMIVLPFFVAFMTMLLFFFRILQVQQIVDNALILTGRELSVAAYESSTKELSENSIAAQVLVEKNLKGNKVSGKFVTGGNLGISLLHSEFQGDYITLVADYKMKFPTLLLGTHKISVTQQVKCRKWTGKGLNSGESGRGEEIVYITPSGSAYHKSRDCTYLKPKVKSISRDRIKTSRNADGSKYYPCSKCKRDVKGGAVYVTDYGNRYHNKRDCSKIFRTVYAVFLSQAGDRHSCSKCGK
ncbi:MAG: pilus assembly protein [Roseburia sp.]|nr:pilus assembly protein [Roseburia sp.]